VRNNFHLLKSRSCKKLWFCKYNGTVRYGN